MPSNVPLIGFVAITTNCVRMKHWPCNHRPPSTCDSPRVYPGRTREPEYDVAFKVRRVQQQGQFRWKSERVFLGTVFEGERVGLLPRDDRYYTIYFGQFPIACLDSRELKIVPLSKDKFSQGNQQEEEGSIPFPCTPYPSTEARICAKSKCQQCLRSKLSGISPAAQHSALVWKLRLLILQISPLRCAPVEMTTYVMNLRDTTLAPFCQLYYFPYKASACERDEQRLSRVRIKVHG